MALQAVPGFIGQAAYQHPVELFRNLTEALTKGGTGLLGSSGGFAMTPSGSLMQLTIAAGYAVINGLESTSQGSYFVWSPTSEVLAWPAHAGSPRIDTLVLRVIDTQYGTDPDTPQAEWEIVQGTPAGSPTAVTDSEFLIGGDHYRPGAWWRVADVLVEVADTNMAATTITDYRKLAAVDDQRLSTGAMFLQTVQFTGNGTFSKATYPNLKKVRVRCQGGGGGGAGAGAAAGSQHSMGGGGGGGAYAESWIDAGSLASSVTVTVGASAAGGTAAANGTAGNASSFGTAVVCPGGTGGTTQATTAQPGSINGGDGGVATAGDVRFGGGAGSFGLGITATLGSGGNGGSAYLGGGGSGKTSGGSGISGAGGAAPNYGGGGGGAFSNTTGAAANGGAGAQGIVLVDVYV